MLFHIPINERMAQLTDAWGKKPLPTPELGLRPTFTFLDPYHILAGFLWSSESQSQPRDLLVCAIDDPSHILHQHLHADTDSAAQQQQQQQQINNVSTYRFRIPKLLKRRDFWEIHTHRNSVPLLPNNPNNDNSDTSSSAAPHYFDNDPADHLVVIEMASRRRHPQPNKPDPALSLCIPARAILRRINNGTHTHSTPPPLVFAWEQWGEGYALLESRLDFERRLPALSRVCGLRHAARKPIMRTGTDGALFHVVDFHPGRASRIAQSRGAATAAEGVSQSSSSPLRAVVEVPLPVEMQCVDPALISTSICQDALIAFEVRVFYSHFCSFALKTEMTWHGSEWAVILVV